VVVLQRQAEQLADAHAGGKEHEDDLGGVAAILLQLFDLGGGENLFLLFDVFRQLDKPGKVGGADLLAHGPCGHLGNKLLVFIHRGMALIHVLIKDGLKVCGAEAAELPVVQRLEYIIGAVVGFNALLADLAVVFHPPFLKDFLEGHIISFGKAFAGELFQCGQRVGFLFIVANDNTVLGGCPRLFAAA